MKSGLYACAGASATASAAACAKRFDEPITNESKVYLGFMPTARRCRPPRGGGGSIAGGRARAPRSATGERNPPLVAGGVPHSRGDQAEEMPLDPLAREAVGDVDDERFVRQLGAAGTGEPRAVRRGVQGPFEPTGDFRPQGLRSQLELALHAPVQPLSVGAGETASITAFPPGVQACDLRGFFQRPHDSPQMWKRSCDGGPLRC